MSIELTLVIIYLILCILVGFIASRKVLSSKEEYWVAGRNIGTAVNSMAIMAALASGGSIIGVMGLAYGKGIPFTLALFAGAIVGFPLASILVAKPLRNFGKFTISDFLKFRFPSKVTNILVPILIVLSFSVYIIAQMKAAGITANVLLGIPYEQAVTISAIVFILYVSFGGMLAVTWTDVVQGTLMFIVVMGTIMVMISDYGSIPEILTKATTEMPKIGKSLQWPVSNYIGAFLIWATAIPVTPHIVMRVFSAKDAKSAQLSLNIAMILYVLMILGSVLVIVPVGSFLIPALQDPDQLFLKLMQIKFPPFVRGLAVAAVMAAVMSTTDALLLACSSAISHDLLGNWLEKKFGQKGISITNISVVWIIGLVTMFLAYSPPKFITIFYSLAIGLLSSTLFIPTIAGIWWKGATTKGALSSMIISGSTYLFLQMTPYVTKFESILYALPLGLISLIIVSNYSHKPNAEIIKELDRIHEIS